MKSDNLQELIGIRLGNGPGFQDRSCGGVVVVVVAVVVDQDQEAAEQSNRQ